VNEKDILSDGTLENLGLIKNIDTFSIILKGQEIKHRRRKVLINILGLITALFIILFNFVALYTVGLKFFLLAQLVFSWLIIISFLPILKKKCI
jgi:hypothetical protein